MYAVIRTEARYSVQEGDVLKLEKLAPRSVIPLSRPVLAVKTNGS